MRRRQARALAYDRPHVNGVRGYVCLEILLGSAKRARRQDRPNGSHLVVDADRAELYINAGYRLVGTLPNGRVVLERGNPNPL